MKALFWLPSILLGLYKLTLPRWLFVLTYKPASPELAAAENDLRNVERLAAYKARKNNLL